MNISKHKEVMQGVFKSYSSLLIPVAIGLVSVLLFIPTQLMSNKLKEEIATESISMGNSIRSLNVVTEGQWKEEQKYQQAHERDANEIELLAKQSTQRELLSYKIFPKPRDMSVLIFGQFGENFRAVGDKLIAGMNARDCPTPAELERSLQSSPARRSSTTGGRRVRRSSRRLSEVDAAIRDELCREKAESASFYANPADLEIYRFWGEYKSTASSWDDAIKDCWYSQLAYWIIEDVIDTIGNLNSGSDSVFTSPVKRLLSVSFGTGQKVSVGRRHAYKAGKEELRDKPSYVFSLEDVQALPCTGRVSNDDIDVVHFNVAVIVSTDAALPFMRELCSAKRHKFRGWDNNGQEQIFKHNQITILEYKITSIDREDDSHLLYRYGDDAVVRLDLICEYVFDKAGYDAIKPEAVKESIKQLREELEAQKAKVRRGSQVRRKTGTEAKQSTKELWEME